MPDITDETWDHNPELSQKSEQGNPLFIFGVIADVQYAQYPSQGTRFYSLSVNKLTEAMACLEKEKVDFTVNLGDLIDRDFSSFEPVMKIINDSELKTFIIAGNHDYSVSKELKNSIPMLTESEKGYYSVIYRNFRLIFLNGNEVSTYASADPEKVKEAEALISGMKEAGSVNAVEWNGGIGKEQINWLTQQLDEAAGQNEKVILLCHFPVAPENIHNLFNCNTILELLSRYRNVVAWFNGHNHAGNYARVNGIHCLTFRGMVETADSNSFAIVRVFADRLLIEGYGREISGELTFK